MTDMSAPHFHDEEAAREHIEASRWPNGPYCPYCGVTETVSEFGGKSMGPGWYWCKDCRRKFTALVGTVMERSHIPLNKWLLAMHLLCSSKKGMSAHQLHRMMGITYKSAWFMAHRIREAMRDLYPEGSGPLGGEGKTVEIDETFVGGKEKNKHASKRKHVGTGGAGKEAVFSLVERKGKVRSHHVPEVTANTLRPILAAHVEGKTYVMTDEGAVAKKIGGEFASHRTVNHSIGEYVRGDIHTNTIESYFAVLKRGIIGTYHHISQQNLKRYLCEFDFRYNERTALEVTDAERAAKVVRGTVGKRVTYQEANRAHA